MKTVQTTTKASQTKIGRTIKVMHEATGMRLAIATDYCPNCKCPGRWFDGTVFGCDKCDYTSEYRLLSIHNDVPLVMTNEQCYAIAALLNDYDFRVMSGTFGFDNGRDMADFATQEQLKVES